MKYQNYFPANEEDRVNFLFIHQFVDVWRRLNKEFKNKLHIILQVKQGHIKYCANEEMWRRLGEEVLGYILTNKKYLPRLKQQTKKAADALTTFAWRIYRLDISKLTNKQLVEIIKQHNRLYQQMIFYGLPPAVMEINNDLLTNYLRAILEKKLKKIKQKKSINDYFQLLTDSVYLGAAKEAQISLLTIACKIDKSKSLSKQLKDERISFLLKKHTEKYFWLRYAYQGPLLILADFIKELEIILRQDPKRELQVIRNHNKNLFAKQKQVVKYLKLTSEEKRLFQAARDCIFIKVYRKDALTLSLAVLEKIIQEINCRSGYSLDQLRACLPSELPLLFASKIFKSELNKRLANMVYFWEGNKRVILTGSRAQKFMNKILAINKLDNVREIKGMVANTGYAKGQVKIINKDTDMVKMKKGDILVSIATIPEIVPAMKKAAAIVTDIGGLTSHAAIVARELKKPCIIGTKIATKVLKDGNLVEVDANKGIVKIINNKGK